MRKFFLIIAALIYPAFAQAAGPRNISALISPATDLLSTDCGDANLVNYNGGSAQVGLIPDASAVGFNANCKITVHVNGAGGMTLSRTALSTIDGGTSIVMSQGWTVIFWSDNTNWVTTRYGPPITAGSNANLVPASNGVTVNSSISSCINNNGTANNIAFYGSNGCNLSPDATLSDDGVTLTYTGVSGAKAPKYQTATNCQKGGASGTSSPAACGSAIAGQVAIPASQTTYTINTTNVAAGSEIQVWQVSDNSGLPSGPACNSGATNPILSGRVAGTSFTFTLTSNGNVTCYHYTITN